MGPFLLTTYLAASLLALATSALAVIQFHEHVRFARSRLSKTTVCGCRGRAMLLVPCCGRELGLDGNLRGLFRQTYSHYMIRFVVESVEDTAYPIILRLIKAYPGIEAEIVVAGPAEGCGQKIHNLLAATAEMPLDVKYLAFADSDARPRRQWLAALLSGLDRPNVAATTGYRWLLPARPSLANYLLHSINGQVAMFLGNHSPTVVWGGSWAIRRELFELIDLRSAWAGKVCEDLVAGSLFRRAGYRVVYEPACMVMSPIDTTLRGACAFIRRQYLFVRCYDPCAWALIVSAERLLQSRLLEQSHRGRIGNSGRFAASTPASDDMRSALFLVTNCRNISQQSARGLLSTCARRLSNISMGQCPY